MTWSEGNVWRKPLNLKEVENSFEFKMIVRNQDGGVMWQQGDNKKFDKDAVTQKVRELERNMMGMSKEEKIPEMEMENCKIGFDKEKNTYYVQVNW